MKNKKTKWLILAIFVLAAGICYGVSRQSFDGGNFFSSGDSAELISEESSGNFNLADQGNKPGQKALESGESGRSDSGTDPIETRDSEINGSGKKADDLESGSEEAEPEQTASYCYVHICGAVNSPGVYELPEGSRIFQAVAAAGGYTQEAAPEGINLAQTVSDGMKVMIPDKEQMSLALAEGRQTVETSFSDAVKGKESDTPGQNKEGQGKVNINTATKEQLMTLTGVGEAKANDILRYREEKGSFRSVEEIKNISGIKDAVFQKIKDNISV